MYQFGGDEDFGARGDIILIISPPRLRLEFCHSDIYICGGDEDFGAKEDIILIISPPKL